MGRYLIRRILQFIPVFFVSTFLIFAMVYAVPGDPIKALGGEKPVPQQRYEYLTKKFNLDDNLFVQYGKYMGIVPDEDPDCTSDPELRKEVIQNKRPAEKCFNGALTFWNADFGESFSGRQVGDILKQRIGTTAKLTAMAFVFEMFVGIAAGVLAGLRRGSFIDYLVSISTTLVISVPVFVLGYAAQLIVGVKLGWLPVSSDGSFKSLIMPAVVLGAVSLAYIARLTRTSLVENLRADYVRTATAKGLSRRRVVGRHALRNSLIPVVTFLGIDLGTLMGGAIVTEGIFNVPGIGNQVFQAVRLQEGPIVVGIVTFLVFVFMVSNLIVDILYAWLDPRIRYE